MGSGRNIGGELREVSNPPVTWPVRYADSCARLWQPLPGMQIESRF